MATYNIDGFFHAVAIVIGFYVTAAIARGKGLDSRKVNYTCFFGILGVLAGARLYHLVLHAGGVVFPSFGLSAWYGGTGSSGGWVGGIVSVLVATQVLKLNLWKFLDSATVAIALAIFLGRIGCFIKGCCFGTPAYLPWAISYSQTSLAFRTQIKHQLIESTSLFALPVHPVQLYEALYVLVLMSVQIVLLKGNRFHGQMFLCFAASYSLARFFLELLRGDDRALLLGIPVPQWIYMNIFLLSVFTYFLMSRSLQQKQG